MPQLARKRGRPKTVTASSPSTSIRALDRALDVLDLLALRGGKTLSELATELGQSSTTMHRVLTALQMRNYVEADLDRQEWHVGAEAFRLGSAFLRRTNVVESSRPVMRDLVVRTGETSNLGIERDGDVIFVSQIETQESIRAFFPPGARAPLHASGIGKALLSALDEKLFEIFIRKAPFARFTDKTIVGIEQLRAELQQVRDRGYSIDDEERTIGMRCVAAPIRNGYGEVVAGISISGPTIRMSDVKLREAGRWVVDAAAEASQRLGASNR